MMYARLYIMSDFTLLMVAKPLPQLIRPYLV